MARNRVTKVSLVADIGGYVKDVRAGKTATTDLRREAERFSRGRYEATVKANTGKARTDITALEKRLQAFSRTPVEGRVNLDTDEARDRLRTLQTRLSEFASRVSEARLGADDADAQAKISRVEASLLALGRRSASPDIDLEGVAAAEADLAMLTGRLQRFDGRDFEARVQVQGMLGMTKSASLLVDTLIMVGPAAVPMAAAAAGPVAAMTTGMGAAAAAGGSALLAFQGVGEALKALDEGDPEKIAEAMSQLNAAGRQFVRFLDRSRPELVALQNVARSGMFPGMEDGLRDLIELGPVWERIVRNSSRALGQLSREGGDALNDPFWRRFFDYIGGEANRALLRMGRSAGNVAEGIAGMVMALDPAADDFSSGLLRMTRRFSQWGRSLHENRQFHQFVQFVRRVSPEVWSTLGTVADAMLEIAEAAAPVGEATLPVIRSVANVLGEIADSSVGPALIGTAVAFATLNRALRTFEAIKASQVVGFLGGVGAEGTKASRAMTAIGRGGVALAGVLIGAAAIEELGKSFDEVLPGANEMQRQLLSLRRDGTPGLSREFDNLGESIRRVANPNWSEKGADFLDRIGLPTETEMREAKAEIGALDSALAGIVSTKGPVAARRAFHRLAVAQNLSKREQRDLLNEMPAFRDALEGAGTDANRAARGLTAAERATHQLGQEMQRLTRRLEGRAAMRDWRDAVRSFHQELRDAPRNMRRGSAAWDRVMGALDGIASAGLTVAQRMRGLDRLQAMQKLRGQIIDGAKAMGLTAKQARNLADRLGLVDQRSKIQILLRERGMDDATQKLRRIKDRADRVPRQIDTKVKGNTGDADRDLSVTAKKLKDIDRTVSRPRADLNKRGADRDIARLFGDLRDLDRQKPTPKADLDDREARRKTKGFAGWFKQQLRGVRDEPVDIDLSTKAEKVWRRIGKVLDAPNRGMTGPGQQEFYEGGYTGPHPPRRVVGVVHGDEQVIRSQSRRKYEARYPGRLDYVNRYGEDPPGYFDGGRVALAPSMRERGTRRAVDANRRAAQRFAGIVEDRLSARVNDLLLSMILGGGATLNWARRQVGKPYQWGGVGPGGYDCSGFMSALTNHLMGKNPHSRLFATGSFPTSMFARGQGTFSIGSFRGSPGHMAGTLNGVNVESSGGVGVRVGGGARGAMNPMFGGNVWHLRPGLIRTSGFSVGGDAGFQGKLNRYERYIVDHESDGRVRANNPSSTAFGIGQLLYDNRLKYSRRLGVGPGTLNRAHQIAMMRMYIEDRYGSSRAAYNFHRSHGWYDDGGFFHPLQPLREGGGAGAWWKPDTVRRGTGRDGVNRSGKPEPVFSAKQWADLRRLITAMTMNRGRPITTDWLERRIDPFVKDIRQIYREFVNRRDRLRGFRIRTERAERRLERIQESDRFERRNEVQRRAERRLKDARSGEAIGEDVEEARRDRARALRRARRTPIGRDALRDYREAERKLARERTADEIAESIKRTQWRRREAREALRSDRARIRQAKEDLDKAQQQREDAKNKEDRREARRAIARAREDLRQARRQPDSAREAEARREIERADRRLKALKDEQGEVEKLARQRDRAGRQSDAVREVVRATKRIEKLREERRERRRLVREARQAGNADIIRREERAQERLNERLRQQKEARREATKAAQAYKAAQEAAIESARAEQESLRGGVDLFGGFISPRGAQRQVDDAIERITDYAQNMAELRRLGVNPWLLEQLRAQGPTEEGVRLGNALLNDKAALSRLSESVGALGDLTTRVGSVTGDPRFLSTMPWNPTGAVATRTLNVDIKALDISAIAGEIRRHVRHEIDAALNAGVV